MACRKLSVTHNSKKYEVEISLDDTVEVLKLQLFSLTNVPPENQKLIGLTKGSVLKEEAVLAELDIKEGQKVILLGGARTPPAAAKSDNIQTALERLKTDAASNDAFKLSLRTLSDIMSKCLRRADWPKPWQDAGHPLLKVVGNEAFAARAGGAAGVDALKLFGFAVEGLEHIALRNPDAAANRAVLDAVRSALEDPPTRQTPPAPEAAPVFEEDVTAWKTCCSRVFVPEPVVQPAFSYLDQHPLCYACATTCQLPGSVKSAVKRTPSGLTAFACACAQIPGKSCLFAERLGSTGDRASGELKALIIGSLSAEASSQAAQIDALEAQNKLREQDTGRKELVASIENQSRHVLMYEDSALQQKARGVIPIEVLRERARTNPEPRPSERDELMVQLLRWFKQEFFRWVNAPPCDRCNGATTSIGMGQPTPDEAVYQAGRVEVYSCGACGAVTRFPR
eukprot:TRINITY_DN4347_c0_g1_i2.p1 TRINITY_DN4347_c0_g1~~TRINITY_DN4347_c0_g1_i2.p1  ORF type:complete len:454 (+),score=131.93 TRINITY_DN4347_c0_g1_i2:185-1546(+)